MSAPTQPLEIRPAREADVAALVPLLVELFAQEEDFAPNPRAHERALRELVARGGESVVLVARRNDRAVGMVSLIAGISTALGGLAYRLEDMIVEPAERGSGTGGALLDAALAWADDRGALAISLLTDASNDGAQRFYGRRGFAPSRMLVMRRPSGGGR